jgi:hypothetical protein
MRKESGLLYIYVLLNVGKTHKRVLFRRHDCDTLQIAQDFLNDFVKENNADYQYMYTYVLDSIF